MPYLNAAFLCYHLSYHRLCVQRLLFKLVFDIIFVCWHIQSSEHGSLSRHAGLSVCCMSVCHMSVPHVMFRICRLDWYQLPVCLALNVLLLLGLRRWYLANWGCLYQLFILGCLQQIRFHSADTSHLLSLYVKHLTSGLLSIWC
jgi:hypothetical protein